MSVNHYASPISPGEFRVIIEKSKSWPDVCTRQNAENHLYAWMDRKSSRGLDLTLDGEVVEIRNTGLSNEADYLLSNRFAVSLKQISDCQIIDEENEIVLSEPLFGDEAMADLILQDCNKVKLLSKENHLAIYGPIRKVHFGKIYHDDYLKNLGGKDLVEFMMKVILNVQYKIPDYGYGNVMEVNGGELTLKLLQPDVDVIIDKYDGILLHRPNENPILITNELLNIMLPASWELVDAYTIVAPAPTQGEWDKLIAFASPFDGFDRYLGGK